MLGLSDTLATPVPDRLAVCVPALSFTVSVPVRVPTAVGVNVTLIVQLEFAASDVPQLSVSREISRGTDADPGQRAGSRLFVSVTGCDALEVPRTWLANVRLVGLMVTCDPQFGNLKFAMRVFQLKAPVLLMYSWVYQNVQSSTGSTVMAL